MSEPRFVHLRVHSDYSMIDGLAKTAPLVKKAAALGMPALAITDFTNLCGLVKFYGAGHGAGIKPIVGADFNVQCDLLGDELTHLTVLAANNTGYQNLTLLISKAYQRGYGAAGPIIDRDWLIELNEGLILLSGGRMGDVGRSLLRGNSALVDECVAFYEEHFPDRYFLELIRTGRPDEESYLHAAVELAEARGLPVVATNDVRFIDSSDFDAHEIRVAIHDGFTLDDPKRPRNYSPQQYMRSEEEMCELFADIPEALANTVEIAKRCNVTVRLGEYFLPQFPTGDMSTEDYLVMRAKEGLEERLAFLFPDEEERVKRRPEYDERLETELQVINQMGFPGYFLIVMEFIQWSKDNGVPVGPGRGSGAGSLVAYALKITDLDPLEFDLLFERFLNPERVSMPDFDVDFCMEKRDQVIEHVADMYGRDAVSQIITFGTMAAKAVIRDVGRVLGHPYGFVDRISKLIPPDPGMTLAKAFEAEPQLPEIYEADEEVKALIDMARKLEGVTRNAGKHAGGVVIAPTKITDFAPLYCDEEGKHPVTQFDKSDVEYAGLVKFDFLGLRTLTIINWALEMINKRRAKNGEPPLDIAAIPLDDKKSFDMLQRSETTAVFQLESRGMKDLIKRLQPDCFEDMIALVALFRPGPLQSGMVDNFIDRKHGREEISYPDVQWQHESLKPVLEPTYGIILYQEQVMQIAQVLSGYTLGGADMLRRAMGKKKPEEMAKQRSVFAEGAEKNGINAELAMKIFDLVEKFAGYGFNKSHSAAYALVSYQTLWLKAHYPAEFMAAVMTADMDNTEKVVGLVDECWRMGLKILPPDINKGEANFSVDGGDIRYGLAAIKSIGRPVIKAIVEDREELGLFQNLEDFITRLSAKNILNKRTIENLIKAGALDTLGGTRKQFMSIYVQIVDHVTQEKKNSMVGQMTLFDLVSEDQKEEFQIRMPDVGEYSKETLLAFEKEVLGIYVSGHPLEAYEEKWKKSISATTADFQLDEETGHTKVHDGAKEIIGGMITEKTIKHTKTNQMMAFITIEDLLGTVEVVVFPRDYEKNRDYLEVDSKVFVRGRVSEEDDKPSKLICEKIIPFEQTKKELWIQFPDKETFLDQEQIVYGYLADSDGNDEVVIYCAKERVVKRLPKNRNIGINEQILSRLMNHFGEKRVKVVEKPIENIF